MAQLKGNGRVGKGATAKKATASRKSGGETALKNATPTAALAPAAATAARRGIGQRVRSIVRGARARIERQFAGLQRGNR